MSKRGKLQLSESAILKIPIVPERPGHKSTSANPLDVPPASTIASTRRNLPWNWKKSHKRKDSFALIVDEGMDEMGPSGMTTTERNNLPSVDELKRIAEDIKNGLY